METRRSLLAQERFSIRDLPAVTLLMLLAAIALRLLGRDWWCGAGDISLWSADIASRHNSQHLLDPYTATHILHGIGLYGLLGILLGHRLSIRFRGISAIALESLWEVIENTSVVIERYREETVSFGYYGDSIANSLGDIMACILGFWIAARAPTWASVGIFLALEGLLTWWIRDGLLLNIFMLLCPLESIREWQAGAYGV